MSTIQVSAGGTAADLRVVGPDGRSLGAIGSTVV